MVLEIKVMGLKSDGFSFLLQEAKVVGSNPAVWDDRFNVKACWFADRRCTGVSFLWCSDLGVMFPTVIMLKLLCLCVLSIML